MKEATKRCSAQVRSELRNITLGIKSLPGASPQAYSSRASATKIKFNNNVSLPDASATSETFDDR